MSKLIKVSTTAKRMQEAMDLKGMKKADLAREANIARGTITNYLNSKYEPKATAINLISRVLNVSEMWLWGYDVPRERIETKKISPDNPQLAEGEKLLLELFRKIPEDRQPEVLELIRVALRIQQ